MTRDAVIETYCRAVARELDLPRKRKRELLEGVRQELLEEFSASDSLELQNLKEALGPPCETANALMESVPQKERNRHSIRKRRFLASIIVGLVLLLAAISLYHLYWSLSDVAYVEETIIVNPSAEMKRELFGIYDE